jgi:flagellar FliL protein
MAEEKETSENSHEAKPKKSKFLLIIIVITVVILGASGFFGWNFFMKGKEGDEAKTPSPGSKKDQVSIVYPLKSFIVNLMGKSRLGNRYLKVTIQLEISSEKDKAVIDKLKPQLRDTIILLLCNQAFDDVKTMEGKLELKEMLLSRVNDVLGGEIVKQIYFTEFVVQ